MERFFKINTEDSNINRIQDNLVRTLNPVFNTPILGGNILQNIPLIVGTNAINHKLGRALQGWYLVRKRGPAEIYDTQDANTTPTKTLLLITDTDVVVDIYVF